jgi:hypothetical protein
MIDYGRLGTKAARVREVARRHLLDHEALGELPTSGRFVFYELGQRGDANKPDPADPRRHNRRSHGLPPGEQDLTDALTWLRERAVVPWSWLVDESRSVVIWRHAPSVAAYLVDSLDEATIKPWGAEPPPLILCESRATAGVLRAVMSECACPIAGTGRARGRVSAHRGRTAAHRERAPVLYPGALDRSGGDIEINARRVLEQQADRSLWLDAARNDRADRVAQHQARAVAAITQELFDTYVATADPERLTRAGLLREARHHGDDQDRKPVKRARPCRLIIQFDLEQDRERFFEQQGFVIDRAHTGRLTNGRIPAAYSDSPTASRASRGSM